MRMDFAAEAEEKKRLPDPGIYLPIIMIEVMTL